MEKFIKGDVVVLPFPFTDLSNQKKRPALIVADLKGDDFWAVQITSKYHDDEYTIPLSNNDFCDGYFNYDSNIRPNKLFTLSKELVLYKVGSVSENKLSEVHKVIEKILC